MLARTQNVENHIDLYADDQEIDLYGCDGHFQNNHKEDDLTKNAYSPQPVQTLSILLRIQHLFPWSGITINAGTSTNYITWIHIFFSTYLITILWDVVGGHVVADL